MIYLELFLSFFKIGLFSFGGGYAMIPLISDIIVKNGWIAESEFIRIIGIAEMTPGPIAVNSATFIGYNIAGILGSFVGTLGVALPSLLIILGISKFVFKYINHPTTIRIFKGIKPVISGLIFSAAIIITKTTLFHKEISVKAFQYEILIIVGILYLINRKFKLHPILLILVAAFLGCGTLLFA